MEIVVLYFMVSFILVIVDLFVIPGEREYLNMAIDEADEDIENGTTFNKIGKNIFKIIIRVVFVILLVLTVIPSKILGLINNQ